MKKISVDLYGGKSMFGGRETPLEADIIYCDCFDKCSFYENKQCLKCRSFLGSTCKRGKVNTVKGYTSKAKKYYSFKQKYESDEMYNKLHYPSNWAVGLIEDCLILNLKYTHVREARDKDSAYMIHDGYVILDGAILNNVFQIPLNNLTISLLNHILSFKPRNIMGGEITDYQNKVVPDIICELKRLVPNLYDKLIETYPQYNIEPNYIGKFAYIRTMTEGSVLTDCHGNKAILRDGKLICDSYTKGFVPFRGASAKCEIEIGEDQTYQITDNSQCNENTRFK